MKTNNFWQTMKKPFFVLAPMANVTDSVFRKMIAKYGKPDVMWTEFVSADGLMSTGRNKLLHNLYYTKGERPIVAQLFTSHPKEMQGAARLIAELGFDGLDINMGCPDRAVEKQGGGARMMKNQDLAIEIIESARRGVSGKLRRKVYTLREDSEVQENLKPLVGGIPVSVKTRIGYNKVDLDWIRILLKQKLPVLTVHLRTRKELSDVPAHWEIMPEIIKLRNEISPETLIIGNGDVISLEDGLRKIKESGCDGIMVGRGIFGKPWFFGNKKKLIVDNSSKGIKTRLKILLEHTKLFEKNFVDQKSFDVMKKHFKAYVNGWDGAKELRVQLMNCKNSREVEEVIKSARVGLAGINDCMFLNKE